MKLHLTLFAVHVMAASIFATSVGAQSMATGAGPAYPMKPVRIIVPYAAGGNTDFTARAIADKLTPVLKQQVIVDNRPGGATNIGAEAVAKAAPDGHTLLMGGASNAVNMSLFAKLPYDTLRDFEPVILCVQGANVLALHPSVPAKNLKELIAFAKTRPGKLNYGSSGVGSSNQMAGELFKLMAGVNIVHVPYKGNAPALTDLLGGHVEMIFSGVPALVPHIESGRIRGIAIGSLKRFPALPKVPTFDEAGLKGYEATTWFGLLAPAKTPREVITRLNTEVDKAIKSADIQQRFTSEGLEPMGGKTEAFAKFIRAEIDKYAKVIKAAAIPKQ
ncbi:MAG TPA: tripartite tricarboxylate transporter substrate binding protein [Burkholderiales bacterium]|nr:tripartite tricarboxylate transporter substrate binding protein [Burkholderiales bacterium]